MKLAVTLGDPRGIGPEIVQGALADPRVIALDVDWMLVGPSGLGHGAFAFGRVRGTLAVRWCCRLDLSRDCRAGVQVGGTSRGGGSGYGAQG